MPIEMRSLGTRGIVIGLLATSLSLPSQGAKRAAAKGLFPTVDLTWKASTLDVSSKADGKVVAGLQKLKQAERSKDWKTCASQGQMTWNEAPLLRNWVWVVWSKCARKSDLAAHHLDLLRKSLGVANLSLEAPVSGSGRSAFWAERIASELAAADLAWTATPRQVADALRYWGQTLQAGDLMDRESRSRVYLSLAEVAQVENNLKAAKQFLQQSLTEKPSRMARLKLGSIALILKSTSELSSNEETEKSEDPSTVSVDATTAVTGLADAERRAEERLDLSFSKQEFIAYLQDAVAYLGQFPSGRRAKQVHDRVLEVESQLLEQENQSGLTSEALIRNQELRAQSLLILKKADPTRLVEWAKNLHRRGDYIGAFSLAQMASPELLHSSQGAQILWLQGRSAQVLGRYPEAQAAFEKYLEIASGGDDVLEVSFRLALVHLRQRHYASASAVLERLLQLPGAEKIELGARYWLVRALQWQGSPRAQTEASIIVQKYPLSYYGLRLVAESHGGELKLPDLRTAGNATIMPLQDWQWSLTPEQAASWQKVSLLARAGWSYEASQAAADLTVPQDPATKMILAKQLSRWQMFPFALRLVSEALDREPGLRNLEWIGFSFPDPYPSSVVSLGQKNYLHPWLIKGLIRQESAFGDHAVSSSNAMGLMQLIPPTAQEVAGELKLGKLTLPEDGFNPELNMEMGSYYLAKMIRQFSGVVPFGVAAYNVGPTKMRIFVHARPEVQSLLSAPSSTPLDELWFDELPWAETSYYVKAVLRNAMIYRTLEQSSWKLPEVVWSDLTTITTPPTKVK